jgi:hypothetical protein
MKKIFAACVAVLFLISLLSLDAQDLIKNSAVTGVCYAGNKVSRYYIPPPGNVFRKNGTKALAQITVNYSGFSTQAKAAVEYAVLILENILPADAKFTINASWEKISTSGVLAQSSITGYAGGFAINARNPLAYYPVALAEKIAGKNLNDNSSGDITLVVNNSINWYLETDGQTPKTKYDLVTVSLHEICHGLGFFDSFSSDDIHGSYGIGSFPLIYDTFIENATGNRLTDTLKFPNNSTDLQSQLVGNQVYFNGPLIRKYSTSVNYSVLKAKLYSPSEFDGGSSISHLDESGTLRANGLMTPFIDLGEAIHDPGKYTMSILGDIGWINTRIVHKSIGTTEAHLTQVVLSAVVESDTAYNHSKVGLVYSFNNFVSSDSLFLNSPGGNNTYSTTIPIATYNTDLQYYFFAEDIFGRRFKSPSLIKDSKFVKNNRYHVYIGTDTVKPVITHSPVTYYLQTVDSIKFAATVTDNLGIDSVYVEYHVNNGPSSFLRLKKGTGDNYSVAFNAKQLSLKGHDSILYKFFAVDTARVPNLAASPKTGSYVTRVEGISTTVSKYSTDFSNAAGDFFNIGFDIRKPAGFAKSGLHSKHPYESPLDNNKTIEYVSILRHPFKIGESGLLFNYNEVVLVEPGVTGSHFGSADFFDYVIIDGSKNFGKTWFNLIDGYDSRLFSSWETSYNSSIVGDNSTFAGTESMLQKHTFLVKPSANFAVNDTLLIRFRLFSDPFANGWGWLVEDLKIGPLVDALPEVTNQSLNVYPNPGKGLIKVTTDQSVNKNIRYRVFSTSGACIVDNFTKEPAEFQIDISNHPAGIYIILVYLDDGIKTVRYSLIK